ncbi:uncharacterized protein isoform X2 [Choristoneura fumiferana]|uniref:uncharacterized protein isoform X2 n=1 Tax=Choristoneura fumiferana TaxID=7141 RepID=UPI003D1586F5
MLKKYVSRLEDPNHPLLGPTLWGLQSWGMWQPNSGLSHIIYNLFHLALILFVLSQYIELWLIRADREAALRNLSVTMLSSICAVKAVTFVFWQKHWGDVINFVSTLEKSQLKKKDKTTQDIIEGYTKYSRSVTYFYWCLVTATVFTVIFAPLGEYLSSAEKHEQMRNGSIPYPDMMSSWFPFEKTRGIGYWVVFVEHSLIVFYGGGIVASYDANAVVLMSFFCGQLELLSANCKELFDNGSGLVNYSDTMNRIKMYHNHHLSLIKYSKILNSLLSPVLFLYVIICSLMICASATLLTTSEQVDQGVYESDWWQCGMRVRRCVLLLGGQLRRTILFTAGPFTTLTVSTFVTILKWSYSYYTLLSNNED